MNYSIATADTITIEVINEIGKPVLTLRSNYIVSAGIYQDSLRMDTFPNGIYFIGIFNGRKNLATGKIIKNLITGLQDSKENDFVHFYPNPVRDSLYFAANSSGLRIETFNSTGQLVYFNRPEDTSDFLDFRGLAAGVYVLVVSDETSRQIFRIVKEE